MFIPSFSTSRKDWLGLKQEYLTLQKSSMSALKKCMNKINDKEHKMMETDGDPRDANGEFSSKPHSQASNFKNVSAILLYNSHISIFLYPQVS